MARGGILIIIAGLSGQRQKDCTTLQWEQVNFELGTVEFARRKNSDTFTAPIHPFLKAHLQELAGDIEIHTGQQQTPQYRP